MRMTVTLKSSLLEDAQKVTGIKIKRTVIEEGLQELIRKYRKREAIKHAGSVAIKLSLKELHSLREHK
ncbi:MAG: type II toxin-antitoxin system VapB family antitoxin [Deltaproteobacteria bacterium]|nr:type II toxin-antitoxin system VapB family antitoxin [Deltaproteobacteria bacterium]MCL5276848.1 type II toxin-antitoxin system VapB family antitoxin [Deltaproteobacteria bacterium]